MPLKRLMYLPMLLLASGGCGDQASLPDSGEAAIVCDTDDDCNDETFCNGSEVCIGGQCRVGEQPCTGVLECDESSASCSTPLQAIQDATWLVLAFSDFHCFNATAFGVDEKLFATNAHVTEALVELFREPNAEARLVQHETGSSRVVPEIWSHPEYDGNDPASTPDVGLLLASSTPASPSSVEPLILAEDAELRSLRVFDEISLCGFPSDVELIIDLDEILDGTVRPRASCLQGSISALRPFDPTDSATPENTFLIQYDLPVARGTSGSAVFDDRGAIIGVNSFGTITGGVSNFAIRSDKLRELMSWAESGVAASTVLADVELDVPACQADSECDDGDGCTIDSCESGQCVATQGCPDGQSCVDGECVYCSTDAECDDGLFCNGQEDCLEGYCIDGSDPCAGDESCNEGQDACENDSLDIAFLEGRWDALVYDVFGSEIFFCIIINNGEVAEYLDGDCLSGNTLISADPIIIEGNTAIIYMTIFSAPLILEAAMQVTPINSNTLDLDVLFTEGTIIVPATGIMIRVE